MIISAIMIIGLKYGATDVGDLETKEKINKCVNEFVGKFKNRNGTILCKELLGCDVSTLEGREEVQKKNLTNMLKQMQKKADHYQYFCL